MKAVIMAGGKGTRLHALTNDEIPKPMAPICGKPILKWQIECLKKNGIEEIMLVVGHLSKTICEYFGNDYAYYYEEPPLGTAGALPKIRDFYGSEDFLLIFGDTLFDIDIARMERFHKAKQSQATLFVHPNSHPFDSDLVILGENNRVMKFDAKENDRDHWYHNIVNAGLYIINPAIIPQSGGKLDLEKDLFANIIQKCGVYGYRSTEYIKDAGTIERISQIESDIQNGVVSARNLSQKQKAIFLDRDGTLNRDMGDAISIENFSLFPEAAEAIRRINTSGYLAIVITNQPMVAKGFITLDELRVMHAKMESLLGCKAAYTDAIYYCPHHPDKGFAGEVPALKLDCACRKPNPGMIVKAAEDWNIDLSASYMIGDSARDQQAAESANVKFIKVSEEYSVLHAVKSIFMEANDDNNQNAV